MSTIFPFPLQRADGLLIRPPLPADIDAVADFNARVHADVAGGTNADVAAWTRNLLSGSHPTMTLEDCLITVDPAASNAVVAVGLQIPQTWRYEAVPFGVGRPELLGTHPDYRQRGLLNQLMGLLHQRSAAQGHLLQAITGIPALYRRYGYEMAADLHGSRRLPARRLANKAVAGYTIRRATSDDLPHLHTLYRRHCAGSPLACVRDDALWRYLLQRPATGEDSFIYVLEADGSVMGYAEGRPAAPDDDAYLFGLAVGDGHSLRAATLALARSWVYHHGHDRPVPPDLILELGRRHAVYDALEPELEPHRPPYGWYLRLPDLPRFLHHIAPVLERRLAAGPMAGHSGSLRLNALHQHLELRFDQGRLTTVEPFSASTPDAGDAIFPGLSFLQLLFGRATMTRLKEALPDCFARSGDARVLLTSLFPARPALINALN